MPRRSKVYLPRWMRWFVLPLLLIVWVVPTWHVFVSPAGDQENGLVGWLLATVVMVAVGVFVWLMTSGRLPAYIVEEESDEDG